MLPVALRCSFRHSSFLFILLSPLLFVFPAAVLHVSRMSVRVARPWAGGEGTWSFMTVHAPRATRRVACKTRFPSPGSLCLPPPFGPVTVRALGVARRACNWRSCRLHVKAGHRQAARNRWPPSLRGEPPRARAQRCAFLLLLLLPPLAPVSRYVLLRALIAPSTR